MTFMPLEQPVIITVNNKPSKGSFGRFSPPQFHQHSNKTGGLLDSWQKVEDHSGVTYYWNTNGNGFSSPPPSSVQQNRSPLTAHRLSGGGLFTLQPPANNNSRRSSKDRTIFVPHMPPSSSSPVIKERSNGYSNGANVVKERHSNFTVGSIFTNGNAKERGGGYMNGNSGGPIVTIVNNNGSAATMARNGYAKSASSKQHHHHHHHQNGGVVTPRTADPSQLIWSVSNSANEQKQPNAVVRKPRARRFLHSLLCCVKGDGVRVSRSQNGFSLPDHPAPQPGPYSAKPSEKLLLPPMRPCDINKKCLIIDLDETLVHSSFKPVKNPDFVIPVEIDGVIHQVYVLKRPYVDEFLQRIGDKFECVLFTASLAKYADPVADLLDKRNVFKSRLFREACVFHKGNYVKDLNRLGRDLKRVIIVDNSPASYAFHPDNAVPVQSWFDDQNDTELLEIIPLLERLAGVDSVYSVLRNSNEPSPPPPPLNAIVGDIQTGGATRS